jgi:cob(I)alamin adenosyltransferase
VKIYTKTGDAGQTGLVGGSRVGKDNERIEGLGSIDELNAALGLARCHTSALEPTLAIIQDELFQVGSEVASVPGARLSFQLLESSSITRLEGSIDEMTAELPPLTSFILPGGSELSALLHLARATCRLK